jgi:cytochrome P450
MSVQSSAHTPPLPVYDVDLFAPAALRHPFEHFRKLRDMGPVVRLADPDVYVLSRYDDVRDALRASDTLISSKGVGFSEAFNTPRGPNLIASDGEQHQRLKSHVLRPLLPAQLRQHRQMLRDMIGQRIKSLVNCGPFARADPRSRPKHPKACAP